LPAEQVEKSIMKVLPSRTSIDSLQIVPLEIGTQKLVISGGNKNEFNAASKKFYVHVSNKNGKLAMDMEETEDVLATNIRLRVAKEKVKSVTMKTPEGKTIENAVPFKACPENNNLMDFQFICILLNEPMENLLIVEYDSGKKVSYAISSSVKQDNFYYWTSSILVMPEVTVDLTKKQGNFSEFTIQKDYEKIIKVTKDSKANIFHIEGIGEGNAYIDFPKSDRRKPGVLGLSIDVRKIANQFQVEVEYFDYEDQFY